MGLHLHQMEGPLWAETRASDEDEDIGSEGSSEEWSD
jgi:hypothetical protein